MAPGTTHPGGFTRAVRSVDFGESLAQRLDDCAGLIHQERGLIDDRDALQIPVDIKTRGELAGEHFVKASSLRRIPAARQGNQAAGFLEVAHDHGLRVPAGVGEGGLGLLVLRLPVDDHGVTVPSIRPGRLPHLLHQHAGRIMLEYGDALAHESGLVVVGRTEGGDDDDVIRRQSVPAQGHTGRLGCLPSIDGQRHPFVALQVKQPPLPEIVIDEGIVDQLREHEHPPPGIGGQRLIGALDRVAHAEAEAKVARNKVLDGAEIEGHRRDRGALVLAGQLLDRGAQARLVQALGLCILRVDTGVAFLLGTELVDEVALAQVQVGNLHEVRIDRPQQGEQRRGQRIGPGEERVNRLQRDLAVFRLSGHLNKKHAVGASRCLQREHLHRPGVLRVARLQPLQRHRRIAAGEGEPLFPAELAHREAVVGVEREVGADLRRRAGIHAVVGLRSQIVRGAAGQATPPKLT